jgi:hypothetical protein
MTGLVLVLATMCAFGVADKKPSVRLYVFAADVPAAEPDAKQTNADRAEAVGEMREALRHKAGLAIVDDRASADVLVEVVGREQRESPEGGFGGVTVTHLGDMIIRLHVVSGDEEVDLKGIGQGTWNRAAKDAADRVLKWVARLEEKRKKGLFLQA